MSLIEIILAAAIAIAFLTVVVRAIRKRGQSGCHCGGDCPYKHQ